VFFNYFITKAELFQSNLKPGNGFTDMWKLMPFHRAIDFSAYADIIYFFKNLNFQSIFLFSRYFSNSLTVEKYSLYGVSKYSHDPSWVTPEVRGVMHFVAGCSEFHVPGFWMIDKNIHIFMREIPPDTVIVFFSCWFFQFYSDIIAAFSAAFFTRRFKFFHNFSIFLIQDETIISYCHRFLVFAAE